MGISKIQIKIQNFKFQTLILIFGFSIFVFYGCAGVKEACRGFAGVSTRSLEDARKDGAKKTLKYDYKTCLDLVKTVLNKEGSYIYSEDAKAKMIAIYVSASDTTPVGIFFTEINANNTQVEISSPSTAAKELIAERIFVGLAAPTKL